jgi:prepilin peptidase CpaA
MTPETLRAIVVMSVAGAAVVSDLRTRRIPNVLTCGTAAVALLAAFGWGGLNGFGTAALAWGLAVLLFLPVFALRGMGAGDVKLLAALAAWLGPLDTVYLAVFASMAGGLVALFVSVRRGYLRQALSNIWLMLMHWRIAGPSPVPGLTLRDTNSPRLAYAIPIAIGALCTLWRH